MWWPALSAVCLHRARRHHGSNYSEQRPRGRGQRLRRAGIREAPEVLPPTELAKKLEKLERKLDSHDQAIVGIPRQFTTT